MDLKNNLNAALLAYEGLIQGKTDFAKIPFYAQKTVLTQSDGEKLKRTAPERTGISSRRLLSLVEKLSASHDAAVHSAYMLSEGKCVLAFAAPGYSVHTPHTTFSMCKTVTGLAIGMLVDDGLLSLSDKVHTFFPEEKPLILSPRTRALTVEHLLTMQSGVSFSEAGAVVETEWIKSYLSSVVRFTPGKKFAYNSMNSYMLAAIVTRVTGRSLTDFLNERLFHPLGIRNVFWEKSPEGIEKGGWGLYLSVASMAKLGQLFLDGGVYAGERIISEKWIREATKRRVSVSDEVGKYDYGYHLWVSKENESFLFNGMLGQNVLVDPRTRTVFAITAGDTCLFQTAHSLLAYEWAIQGLKKEKPRLPSLCTFFRLRRAEKNFGKRECWLPLRREHDEAALEKSFEDYKLFSEHSVSANNAGLLPMLWRLVQNNHTGGLCDLTLKKCEDGDVLLSFLERDESYTLRLGHRCFKTGTVTVHGEPYRVACGYAFSRDEARVPVFKAQITFPELSVTRRLIIKVLDGHLTLLLFEAPDFTLVEKLLTSAHLATGQNMGVVSFIRERVSFDGLLLRASTVFSPVLRLKSLSVPIDVSEADDPLNASAPIPNTVIPSLADPTPHKDDTAEKLLAEEKKSEKKAEKGARAKKAPKSTAKKP